MFEQLIERLCRNCGVTGYTIWRESYEWERHESNDWELWDSLPEELKEACSAASRQSKRDPAEGLRLHSECAVRGAAWSMEAVAWHHWFGKGTAIDLDEAEKWYNRAIEAGSWSATIELARLLEQRGKHDQAMAMLDQGVKADFIPAYFWHAWLRLERSRGRRTAQKVRPLLEKAMAAGHPGAELALAKLQASGKFGLKEIPAGFAGMAAMRRQRMDGLAAQPRASRSNP